MAQQCTYIIIINQTVQPEVPFAGWALEVELSQIQQARRDSDSGRSRNMVMRQRLQSMRKTIYCHSIQATDSIMC